MRIVLDLQGAQSESSRSRGIGRYSLALAEAIAREAGEHEVWVALNGRVPDSIEPLRAMFTGLISPERIRTFELPMPVAELDLTNSWRMQAAELLREKFLADLQPDIVHVSTLFEGAGNEVVASVGRLNTKVPTAVTLYDLIPMLRPSSYLADPLVKRSYLRRLQSLKRADHVLAISESSRQEAIGALQIPPERITAIGAGVRRWFASDDPLGTTLTTLTAQYGLRRPFVLYTAGDDPRKNLQGLIAAYALLPDHLRAGHQLAIVCKLEADSRTRLAAIASDHGLAPDEIPFLGYVPDEDLRLLYRACAAFVFPSLHEGFGLPLLEAMAGGAPVIASNCTSIPEIIDRADALFDPKEPGDIARRLTEVLSNSDFRDNLKSWGRRRVATFTWESCARRALKAFEALHADHLSQLVMTRCRTSHRRPLLAFVAPLPPERTGVADYSARLIANLSRHYEIVCIVDQSKVADPGITAEFPIRDVRWFELNARSFERVLYHFGNSPFHKHMFSLLERHPGVVVLHDFYLSNVLNWMSVSGYAPDRFTKALYASHGFSGLQKDQTDGREASTMAFPCNADVLRGGTGIIVHSRHALALARTWYGEGALARIHQIPFLPFPPQATDRVIALKRLRLPENAFVACSFGSLGPMKLSDRLLEVWLTSPMAQDEACFLIFAGENQSDEYGRHIMERIAHSGIASRIWVTGYNEQPQYGDYLAAVDMGVQLRTGSRGETSGAIFDCLSRGVPLIVNAHGSARELPDDAVSKLDDDFSDEALGAALEQLRLDAPLRQSLAVQSALHLNRAHHPERIAGQYWEIIEENYRTSSRAREKDLVQAIARISAPTMATNADLAAVAVALVANRESIGPAQILIDVTNVARFDSATKIERLTRAIFTTLIADPPLGYRVEPIRAVADGYVYARRLAGRWLGLPEDALDDELVETYRGDIFAAVACSVDLAPWMKPWFLDRQRNGTQIVFILPDLLPAKLFPSKMESAVIAWLKTVAEVADGVICASRNSADELHGWLGKAKSERSRPLSLGFFHPRAESHTIPQNTGVWKDASERLATLPDSDLIPGWPWQQSSRELFNIVLGKHWYRSWPEETAGIRATTIAGRPEFRTGTILHQTQCSEPPPFQHDESPFKTRVSLPDGQSCYFSIIDGINRDAYLQAVADGQIFDWTWKLFYQWIRPGEVFFDVGSNVGVFSLPAALKGSETYAFELLCENTARLREGAIWNGVQKNLRIVQAAIGDFEGEVLFQGSSAWGHVVPDGDGIGDKLAISTTLDKIVGDLGISRVNFLKIDIEGSELRAFRGADTLLRRDFPDIILEANVLTCGNNHYSYRELLTLLSSYGYRIYRILNGRLCHWSVERIQEVIVVDYFLTLKPEKDVVARTSWTISPITVSEQVQAIIDQDLYTDKHRLYTFAIADSLPKEVLQDFRVRQMLEKWRSFQDEAALAILRTGSA
jgi:FkbM family methyltransferase